MIGVVEVVLFGNLAERLHLLFDRKLFGESLAELQRLVQTVHAALGIPLELTIESDP